MQSESQNPLLLVRQFSARHGRIEVVFDVDFEVARGEMLAVLGPNGAGKSSLLSAIAGVVHGDGRLEIDGADVTRVPAHLRASEGIAFVPEQRRNIFPTMSVEENISLGLRLTPLERRDAVRADILDMFPILRERMRTAAGMLSGGEQQMLAVGMALGREPSLLVMDEPSQGLAPAVFDILERAFNTLKKRNIALLLAEQNLPFATRVADRYIVLSQGAKVASGSRADLSHHDEIMAHFLGHSEAKKAS